MKEEERGEIGTPKKGIKRKKPKKGKGGVRKRKNPDVKTTAEYMGTHLMQDFRRGKQTGQRRAIKERINLGHKGGVERLTSLTAC